MRNAIWRRLGWPALIGLVVGLLIGGGIVYALTSVDAITPPAGAQGADADEGVVVADVVDDCRQAGVPYATDAAFISAAGIPTVVFGPGSIEQAHTDDEWLPLDQLEQAAEVLYRFVRTGLDWP